MCSTVERELTWLVVSFTHRVSSSLVSFLTSEPQKSGCGDWSCRYGTTTILEIRVKLTVPGGRLSHTA